MTDKHFKEKIRRTTVLLDRLRQEYDEASGREKLSLALETISTLEDLYSKISPARSDGDSYGKAPVLRPSIELRNAILDFADNGPISDMIARSARSAPPGLSLTEKQVRLNAVKGALFIYENVKDRRRGDKMRYLEYAANILNDAGYTNNAGNEWTGAGLQDWWERHIKKATAEEIHIPNLDTDQKLKRRLYTDEMAKRLANILYFSKIPLNP